MCGLIFRFRRGEIKTGFETRTLFSFVFLFIVITGKLLEASPYGENVDYWPSASPVFETDSMYLGVPFVRDSSKPLIVRSSGNSASCTGWLYFMVQDHPDSAYPLFTNKSFGARVRLDSIFDIPHRDTVFFMYKVDMSIPLPWGGTADEGGCDSLQRYTGPNRAPGDPGLVGVDRYYTNNYRDTTVNGTTLGRRFSVAGWIKKNGLKTDTVQFAFEDKINGVGSSDFDDMIFKVVGIHLGSAFENNRIESLRIVDTETDSVVTEIQTKIGTTVILELQGHYGIDLSDWTALSGDWTLSGDVVPAVPPPNSSFRYQFQAQQPGTATLTVSVEDIEISIPVTVDAATALSVPCIRQRNGWPAAFSLIDLRGRYCATLLNRGGFYGHKHNPAKWNTMSDGLYFVIPSTNSFPTMEPPIPSQKRGRLRLKSASGP